MIKINNTQIDNAKDCVVDVANVVMSMYNLMECSHNYSKTFESLWQYYRDEPAAAIVNSKSFKTKIIIAGQNPVDGNTTILSNFWRNLEMLLINCEINFILTWSSDGVILSVTRKAKLAIRDTKLYVNIATLLTQDSAKLLKQLK